MIHCFLNELDLEKTSKTIANYSHKVKLEKKIYEMKAML